MPDLRRKMLFTTLWNTGARLSEALALIRGDFLLRQQYPFVQLATLQQREDKAEHRAGRRALPPGAAVRFTVRDAAGDDDRHPAHTY